MTQINTLADQGPTSTFSHNNKLANSGRVTHLLIQDLHVNALSYVHYHINKHIS